jgi:hypothetical protein
MNLRIYIAGPMESVGGNYNFPLFDQIAVELRSRGAEVFNPADNARAMIGPLEQIMALDKKDMREWRRRLIAKELAWICSIANAMLMLPGWERSPGATAERAVALALGGIDVKEAPDVVLPHTHIDLFQELD